MVESVTASAPSYSKAGINRSLHLIQPPATLSLSSNEFMHNENSIGDRTYPCLSPFTTPKASLTISLIFTTHFDYLEVGLKNAIILPFTPIPSRQSYSLLWFTRLYAFLKSVIAANIPFYLVIIMVCPKSAKIKIWSSQPLPSLKPPCFLATNCYSSTTFTSLSWVILIHITQ